jgi:predicted lipid-binding transport protein (Tim44 family)
MPRLPFDAAAGSASGQDGAGLESEIRDAADFADDGGNQRNGNRDGWRSRAAGPLLQIQQRGRRRAAASLPPGRYGSKTTLGACSLPLRRVWSRNMRNGGKLRHIVIVLLSQGCIGQLDVRGLEVRMTGKYKVAAIACGLISAAFFGAAGSVLAQSATQSSAPSSSAPGNTLSPPAAATGVTPAQQAEPAPSYPQTAEGFNAQYAAVVAAYQAGDNATGRRLLEQFRLPHSADWFAEYLGPEQSAAIDTRYDRIFERFVNHTENTLTELARGKKSKLGVNMKPATLDAPQSPTASGEIVRDLSGIVPLKHPVCFNAHFGVQLTGKSDLILKGEFKSVSWEDTYTYQDGAFRFLGQGAYPFWVWQAHPDANAVAGPNVPTPLDYSAETVDEVIPFAMDKVTAALKSAMASENCNVTEEAVGRIECKRPRVTANSKQNASGGESVTGVLEAQGNQTHVRITTGKGFYGRLVKSNYSVPIYEAMVKVLKTPQP